MSRTSMPALALTLVVCALAGCLDQTLTDVSEKPEYKSLIGSRYKLVGELSAYGVRKDLTKGMDYINLIPPPGIAGPEIGFEIPMKAGTIVTVLKVMDTNRWPDPDMTFIVRVDGTPLPVDKPVHLDLYRGNQGADPLSLNPKIYRKIWP